MFVKRKEMFGIIGNLKRKHLGKRPAKTRRAVGFVDWAAAGTGVLFVAKEEVSPEYAAAMAEFLRKRVELEVVCYVPSPKRIPQEKSEREHYLTPQSVAYSGKVKEEPLRQVLEKSYDLLVDLSEKADGIYDYIVGQTEAKCKIGRERPGGRYDVAFADVRDAADWQERLDYLLKAIKPYSK